MPNLWQTVTRYLQTVMNPASTALNLRAGSGPITWAELAEALTHGGMTSAGIYVSETTALNLSAVWCAVTNIAGTVGTLPLILYRRLDNGGRERFADHVLYRVLHDQPHPEMTAAVFWTTLEADKLLWGNGYAEILRDAANRVRALAYITPDRVKPKRDDRTNDLYYEVTNPSKPPLRLEPARILHVKGLSRDGITGDSVIKRARQGMGLSLATEQFGTALFGRGPQWSGILQHPKSLRPETKAALRADLKGLAPGDWPMLEDGVEWKQIGMPADDAQFLETRQFQVVEVARWFNIPPHKLKDLERATFSNIEEQGLDYLTDTIRPELVNIAQEVNAKLIAPSEQRLQYTEHLVDALLRGRTVDRNNSYAVGRQWGWLSANDIRAMENMNPVNGGDQYLVPRNMAPADRMNEIIDAETAPDPEPEPPAPSATDDRKAIDVGAQIRGVLDEIRAKMLSAIPEPPAPVDHEAIIRAVVVEIREQVVKAIPPAPEPFEIPDVGSFVDDLRAEIIKAFPPAPEPLALPEPPVDPVVDPEPEPAPESNGDARRHARIVTSHRLVVEDAVRRLFTREKDRMRPAAKSPERLRAWVGEFYERHAESFRSGLMPGIASHCAYMGGELDPDLIVRDLVAAWCAESTRQIHALLDRQPADLQAEVEAMLVRWEVERLHGIPDAVMQEMIGHAHG